MGRTSSTVLYKYSSLLAVAGACRGARVGWGWHRELAEDEEDVTWAIDTAPGGRTPGAPRRGEGRGGGAPGDGAAPGRVSIAPTKTGIVLYCS